MNYYRHLFALLAACLIFAIPVFAEVSEGASGGLLPADSESPAQPSMVENANDSNTAEAFQPENAEEGVNLGLLPASPTTLPTTPPVPTRTETSVRSVVGSGTEIINIDGLDVPLADGSSVYIPFVDIAKDAYYAEAVAWAYKHDPQITDGVTELSFGPNATCTRGQMVTFLWRAAGEPEPTGTAAAFSDVVAGSYYEKAVAWAVENGITDGVGGGRFAPNGIVNRAQAVTFLYRAKGAPVATAGTSFTDVASGAYYADAVAWAVVNGVTDGVGNNAFAPNNNCVRGQTVTLLYRAYK